MTLFTYSFCGIKTFFLRNCLQSYRTFTCFASAVNISEYDSTQIKLMKENCVEVSEHDKVIKPISKMDCHLMKNGPPLHRAFSLFLFNSKNELLLQRRADSKITFPGYYTNTCCSHPLFNDRELDEANNIGIKKAAQRRVEYELGIAPIQMPLSSIHYVTRVHYFAPYSDVWGEHEIDYILIARRDIEVAMNTNEVSEVNAPLVFLCTRKSYQLN